MGERKSFLSNLQSNVKNKDDSLSFYNTLIEELKKKKDNLKENAQNKQN